MLPSDSQDHDGVLEQRTETAPYFQDINPQCGDCTWQRRRMSGNDPWTFELLGVASWESALTDQNRTMNVFVTSGFNCGDKVRSILVVFLLVLYMSVSLINLMMKGYDIHFLCFLWATWGIQMIWLISTLHLTQTPSKRLFLMPLRTFHHGINYLCYLYMLCFTSWIRW